MTANTNTVTTTAMTPTTLTTGTLLTSDFKLQTSDFGFPTRHNGQSAGFHRLKARRPSVSKGTRWLAKCATAASPRTMSVPTATVDAPAVVSAAIVALADDPAD